LELVWIPGVGAKTARRLFMEFYVTDLATLRTAIEQGKLENVPGIGPKMRESLRTAVGLTS
jgi:DNA polymerase (family 10)